MIRTPATSLGAGVLLGRSRASNVSARGSMGGMPIRDTPGEELVPPADISNTASAFPPITCIPGTDHLEGQRGCRPRARDARCATRPSPEENKRQSSGRAAAVPTQETTAQLPSFFPSREAQPDGPGAALNALTGHSPQVQASPSDSVCAGRG